MRKLSNFERALVLSITAQNASNFPDIEIVINELHVSQASSTGVGAYIRFDNTTQKECSLIKSGPFGYRGRIGTPGVPSGLGAELDVEDHRLNYVELFTYGDEMWDGDTNPTSFELIASEN